MFKSNWGEIFKKYDIKNKLKNYYNKTGLEIAIQGEIVGMGIQGNKYKFDDLKFFIFNIYDIKNKRWFSIDEIVEWCEDNRFNHVPIIKHSIEIFHTMDEMIEISKGKSVLNSETIREGLVWRKTDQSQSFKVINLEFLLKHEE